MRSSLRFLAVLFTLSVLPLTAQVNMALVGHLDYQALHNSDVSDIWGYVDEDGNEYALVGVDDGGVSVVSLADPSDPQEVFYYPGVSSIWRDIKVWNDHAYITTEGGGGLAIIDLGPLPQSNNLPAHNWQGSGWTSAHDIYIDENGIAYIFGANRGNGGAIFLDLNPDPDAPVEIGEFDTWYIHDGMVRGDTLYASHVYEGFFSIVNVSDKQAPVIMGTRNTADNFTHNCWPSDDDQYLFTTDEVSNGKIGSYDISDPGDIQELDETICDPGSGTIPHNTFYIDGFLVTSYYRYGTVVHDATRPANVIEVAHYDHSPFSGNGFNGAWGTYPYLPSGLIISSDIEGGLFVLQPTYVHACWLEGTITDQSTTMPVSQAQITLSGVAADTQSGLDGHYATGYHQAGFYDVLVSAPGYEDQAIAGVSLQNGVVAQLDVALVPLTPFAWSGQVLETGTNAPVPFAQLAMESADYSFQTVADTNGVFQWPALYADTYTISAGQWGWHTYCTSGASIDQNTPPLTINVDPGYMDDFSFDLGWQIASTASTGAWERGVPVGTFLNGSPSNPDEDVAGDCGEEAYVTGNGGGQAGDDDVDNGSTILISPVFDVSGLVAPRVEYQRWFFDGGGNGMPNDRLDISLTNGTDTVLVDHVDPNTPGMSTWQSVSILISDHLPPTNTMRLIAEAADDSPGHVVEGALDDLAVVGSPVAVHGHIMEAGPLIAPVPNDGTFTVRFSGAASGELAVLDLAGRELYAHAVRAAQEVRLITGLVAGTYLLHFTDLNGGDSVTTFIVD